MPAIPAHVRGARFTGWGTALGHRTVTNDDLAATMDTNDAWIRERTGIERRHVGGTNAELSTASGSKALAMAGIDPASIDALVL
ncbi:MAG: 3-oxoacyl-ACP synthase, partial [Actinomycetota bacterium]